MTGKSHKTGATLATLTLGNHLINQGYVTENICIKLIIFVVGGIIGGYLSDADTPHSHISRKLWFILWPLWIIQSFIHLLHKISPQFIRKKLSIIDKMTGHRGIAHTPYFWILLWLLIFPIVVFKSTELILIFIIAIFLGVGTHLLLDAVFGGIPMLFPISTKRIKLSPFKTDGIVEFMVFIAMSIGCIKMIYEIFKI